MRLRVEPTPSPEEAAAIEMALAQLVARGRAGLRRLRYGDIAPEDRRAQWNDRVAASPEPAASSWSDAARRESIDSGV